MLRESKSPVEMGGMVSCSCSTVVGHPSALFVADWGEVLWCCSELAFGVDACGVEDSTNFFYVIRAFVVCLHGKVIF